MKYGSLVLAILLNVALWGGLMLHHADRYARGYWHLNDNLVPVATIDKDGRYWDGTLAIDIERAWAAGGAGRDIVTWCFYVFVGAGSLKIVNLVMDDQRRSREHLESMAEGDKVMADIKAGKPGAIEAGRAWADKVRRRHGR